MARTGCIPRGRAWQLQGAITLRSLCVHMLPRSRCEMDCESADDFPSAQIGKDRLAALKESVSKLDKEWKTSRNKDWEYIAHLVRTHQSDKLSWKHFLKPEIQDWIEFLIDSNDLTKSRTR